MANNDNIIYAKFNHGREITTDSRSQYAYGQVVKISGLHLPASFDADISNKGDKQAVPRIGTNNELEIDDAFFLSGKDVIVMINVHAADKDGRTKYIIKIPVEKRPERADIELEPVEQDVISVAIATLNEAVEQTSASAESAENSANRAHESAISAEQSATNAFNSEALVEQYMNRAETAAENAERSETKAKTSEVNAKASETHAEQIATEIEQFTSRAETASTNAESSASTASQKATEASNSADIATARATEASTSATNAHNSETSAQQSASDAFAFKNSASASASSASANAQQTGVDRNAVESAKQTVLTAVSDAQSYATTAQSANQAIQNMDVEAVTLEVGSDVTVEKSVDPVTGAVTLTYGIPKGIKGDRGDKGDKGDKGDSFVYSDFTPEQLASLKGEKGDKGDQGIQGEQGIQGIQGIKGDTGKKGDKGDKGDAFTYADFTSEQLASLKGVKGDKGDAFEYSDFTQQQLASLKGEKGDKGEDGQDYVLTENDKQEIAGLVDVPVDDVQINGTSIVNNGVANVPILDDYDKYGMPKIVNDDSFKIDSNGQMRLRSATASQIKTGTSTYRALAPVLQHAATFYGLAKAAGDTTQSTSSNAVGTYTSEAKTAIKQMLGVKDDYDSLVVEVSGTDPVITGKPSYRYNCGELYTLSVTPPAKGTIDIIFTSGTTPTVLSLPNTVKMPDWWVGVETNTTYEMCITDGVYCGVMSWAT